MWELAVERVNRCRCVSCCAFGTHRCWRNKEVSLSADLTSKLFQVGGSVQRNWRSFVDIRKPSEK